MDTSKWCPVGVDSPAKTLNLSSASGRPYQSLVPYPSDPIIDSNLVCLLVSQLNGNRSRPTSPLRRQAGTSPSEAGVNNEHRSGLVLNGQNGYK